MPHARPYRHATVSHTLREPNGCSWQVPSAAPAWSFGWPEQLLLRREINGSRKVLGGFIYSTNPSEIPQVRFKQAKQKNHTKRNTSCSLRRLRKSQKCQTTFYIRFATSNAHLVSHLVILQGQTKSFPQFLAEDCGHAGAKAGVEVHTFEEAQENAQDRLLRPEAGDARTGSLRTPSLRSAETFVSSWVKGNGLERRTISQRSLHTVQMSSKKNMSLPQFTLSSEISREKSSMFFPTPF